MSISLPARSRWSEFGLSGQGSSLAASLVPRSSLQSKLLAGPTKPQALRMLDGPLALFVQAGRGIAVWWRSEAPCACLCQLQTRSMAFKLLSGVRTCPPVSVQESRLQVGMRVLRCPFQQRATPLCFSKYTVAPFWGERKIILND